MFATTDDTGDPMAAPAICLHVELSSKREKNVLRQSSRSSLTCFDVKAVLSFKLSSFSSFAGSPEVLRLLGP